jgi:hypothetical protein
MQVLGGYNYGVPWYYETALGPLPGASLWESAPSAVVHSDPSPLVYYNNDFLELTIASNTFGGWAFTAATSGSVAQDTTGSGGILKLDAGAVTANQGVNFQLNNVPFAVAAGKPVWYEARVKFTGLTSLKVQTFIGLAVTNTAIIAAGASADIDRIGFQGITTTGVLASATHSGAGNLTTGTGLTLVNSTWYRLGFLAQTTGVDFYVDGAKVGTTLATNIPTAALAPAFVCQANATVQPVLNVDYLRVVGCR